MCDHGRRCPRPWRERMITTPICDFVRRYSESSAVRLHMPGHKGSSLLGSEPWDITEIEGADSLYEADGIIKESERNAGKHFGADTFYSTEGSSLCIRAMLYLAVLYAREQDKKPLIAAGRNVHKTFVSSAALLDFDILWLYPDDEKTSYLSCKIDAKALENVFLKSDNKPTAVYLTSPDYLGNTVADMSALAEICHKHGAVLIIDNAHGAYLKFLASSQHPIDLGADICCDSAHKTLPVLTGGAYLHISLTAPKIFTEQAKTAMSMFGSTSPSYLILQSLDLANQYLENYQAKLASFIQKLDDLKKKLISQGFSLIGNEPLKLTVDAKKYGYTGKKLAAILAKKGIVSEFSDPDFLVLMFTPEITVSELTKLEKSLLSIPKWTEITEKPPIFARPERILSVREASFMPRETVPLDKSLGQILASANVACPPAVPIVVCGERIDSDAINCMKYYGIETCSVVKE